MNFQYYAMTGPGRNGINGCFGLIRECKERLLERYNPKSDTWISDPELVGIYVGKIEVDVVSPSDATLILARLKRTV